MQKKERFIFAFAFAFTIFTNRARKLAKTYPAETIAKIKFSLGLSR
jgi:hypothetical protein